ELSLNDDVVTRLDSLACPICYQPLIRNSGANPKILSPRGLNFRCQNCQKAYSNYEEYIDLSVTDDSNEYVGAMPSATEVFRNPLVSYLYERGYGKNFTWSGFSGLDKEFETVTKYLQPTLGGIIVDASCGSGMFSRRFAKNGMYSVAVALDFTENMLKECYGFVKQESITTRNLVLVRADISRLPFVTSSVDAVHAGAAIHCCLSPSTAVRLPFF
ncbi:hypothetical protein AMTR_s00010p00172800, partial [Amborella trichopoda]